MNKLLPTLGIISSIGFSAIVSAEALTDYSEAPPPSEAPAPESAPVPSSIPGLTLFTDRVAFEAICTNSQTEDFESNLGPFSVVGFNDPLDEFTNNAVFSPGSIKPGLIIDTPATTSTDLALVGPGFSTNTSHAIYANHISTDTLNVNFPNNDVTCIGMDLGSLFGASTLNLSIEGPGGPLGLTTSAADNATSTFWGVVSTIGPINKIHLSSQTLQAEGVDNITYGTGTPLSCVGDSFEPPFAEYITLKSKSKRVIPVKMALVNDLTGELVGEGDIAAPVVNVYYTPIVGVPGYVTDELLPAGAANDDNIFRYSAEENYWIYNMGTKPYYAVGDYIVTAAPGDSTYTIDPASCTSTFTRME